MMTCRKEWNVQPVIHLAWKDFIACGGCKRCGHISKDAHIAALKDYFLINGQSITNGQFRDFLGISSIHQSRRMLSRLDLNGSGEKKGRVYTPGKTFPLWD